MNLFESGGIGEPEGGGLAGEPGLDRLGHGEAGESRAADAVDVAVVAEGGVPVLELVPELSGLADLVDVLGSVAAPEGADGEDAAGGIEADEEVTGAGVTDEVIGVGGGLEGGAERFAGGVQDGPAVVAAGSEAGGGGEELPGVVEGDVAGIGRGAAVGGGDQEAGGGDEEGAGDADEPPHGGGGRPEGAWAGLRRCQWQR